MFCLLSKYKKLEQENKELKKKLEDYEKTIKLIKQYFNFPDDDFDWGKEISDELWELASISDEEFWGMLD